MALDFPSSPTDGQLYSGYVYDATKGVWSHFDYLSGTSILGTIYAWPLDEVPSWALECNGQAVSRTTYSGLFALIGTTYGVGDGSTTFNLPDFRGRVLVGQDTGQTEFDTLGEAGGAKTHTLTVAEMPSHNHPGSLTNIGFGSGGGSGIGLLVVNNGGPGFWGANIASQGGGGAHNNLQPYRVVKWIICATSSTGDFNTEVQTALVTRVNAAPLSENFIVNGGMDIWQRGTTGHTGNGVYSADRWIIGSSSGSNSVFKASSGDLYPPNVGVSSSLVLVGTTATNPLIRQRIESTNSASFAGQTVTLSFYAINTLGTGAIKVSTAYPTTTTDTFGTWASPTTTADQTLLSVTPTGQASASWTRYSVTFTASSSAVLGYQIDIIRETTSTTTGTRITGVQLELGSTVTPFRRNSPNIQAELSACQRYFWRLATASASPVTMGQVFTTSSWAYGVLRYPVTMRTTPVFSASAAGILQVHARGIAITASTAITTEQITADAVEIRATMTSTAGFANGTAAQIQGSGVGWIQVSADL